MRHLLSCLLLLVVPLSAQTTNVFGTNELIVNGVGAGGTSCIQAPSQSGGLTLDHNVPPNTPIITAVANNCVTPGLSLAPLYSVDLDLVSLQIVADGTGAILGPGFLSAIWNSGPFGSASFNIPNSYTALNGAFGIQEAYLSPGQPGGIVLSAAFDAIPPVCTGLALSLGDDAFVQMNLGFTFIFYGTSYTDCFVNSNGNITFVSGDIDFTESVSELLSDQPRIAQYWDDFSPNNGGTVTFSTTSTDANVCFDLVPEYVSVGENTFSVTITATDITCTYGNMGSADGIVGVSPGGNIDLTGTGIDVTSANVNPPGGGTFPPNTCSYEFFNSANPNDLANTTANIQWLLDALGHPLVELN